MKRCSMSVDMLEKVMSSLDSMISYADDGMVDRDDPDFAFFYGKVDEAREVLEKLKQKYLKVVSK